MRCPIARSLNVIGDWWTLLVVRDVALGISRFDALQDSLGISRKVLSQRLATLCEHGIVERTPYQDNPPRYDYRLTQKGLELGPLMAAMGTWGNRWVPELASEQPGGSVSGAGASAASV